MTSNSLLLSISFVILLAFCGVASSDKDILLKGPENGWYINGGPVSSQIGSWFLYEDNLYSVCDTSATDREPTNWLRTNFIDVKGAVRVDIVVNYTMRKCQAGRKYCKEYFKLYAYQTSKTSPKPNPLVTSFDFLAQAKPTNLASGRPVDVYQLKISVKTTNKGLYLAFFDQGACMSLLSVLCEGHQVTAALPIAISPLKNKTVTKGDPIRLLCNATGSPAPNVSWSKTGGTINPSYVSGNVLMIPRAEVSDAGKYTCTARNDKSTMTVEAFVTVKLRPHSPVPVSTQLTHLSIKVHWKIPDSHGYPVLMYSIHKAELNQTGHEVASRTYHVNEDVHQYEVGDIKGGKTYKFYVTAWNTHGESVKDQSKTVTVKVQKP